MEIIHSQLKMLLEEDQNSHILMQELVNGGNAHSKEEINGFGKLEFSIEETVVDQDLREPKSVLEDRNVVRLPLIHKMDNGMK